MGEFKDSVNELIYNFKSGRNHSCYIKLMSEGVLDVECSKCHTLCTHVFDLAQNYLNHPLSIEFFQTLWFHSKVTHKTLMKALNVISKTTIQNVEPNSLSAIVDGNNETYTVVFEDNKKYCACIYGKQNKGLCYHQVATLLSALLQKRLNTSEVKQWL